MKIQIAFKRIFFTLKPDGQIKEWKLRGLILLILLPPVIVATLAILFLPADAIEKTKNGSDDELLQNTLYHQQQNQFFIDQQKAAMGGK